MCRVMKKVSENARRAASRNDERPESRGAHRQLHWVSGWSHYAAQRLYRRLGARLRTKVIATGTPESYRGNATGGGQP